MVDTVQIIDKIEMMNISAQDNADDLRCRHGLRWTVIPKRFLLPYLEYIQDKASRSGSYRFMRFGEDLKDDSMIQRFGFREGKMLILESE